MTPDRWEQVSSLFADALERPVEARARFLEDACGEDAQLRAEVEALLARHGDAQAYFEGFADDLTPAAPDEQTPLRTLVGTDIGPYRLVQELGRGGMGVVYRAARSDGTFEQEVALKLLPTGVGAEQVQRFEAERQILAPLQHPHIARLLDGGFTADGTPYFVMDYVDGVPITTYCDRQRLTLPARLALFRQVCAAVQYAHQNLVVHRDLKPSNILVTADGEVKLLDFGIAKLIDPSAGAASPLTQAGARLMTPEYASPEQIRGEAITTGSDVYQLGVLLYELLTGRRPYQLNARALREMERIILEEEPTRPSTVLTQGPTDQDPDTTMAMISAARATVPQRLQRELRGDLDQIVLKALHKQAARRYSSVEAMANDVARHLQGLPVLAQGDSWAYRSAKFLRRHRATVAALSLTFVSLAVGLGVAVWQGQVAQAQRDVARQQQRLASEVTGFMKDMFFYFANALPEDVSPSSLDVLQQGVVHARQLEGEDPQLAGAVLHEVADLHIWIQAYPQADVLFEEVLDLSETPLDQAAALERLATSARLQNDLERALPLYERAVALADQALAPDHPDLAFVLNTYAIALRQQDDLATAEAIQRRVVAIREAQPLTQHHDRAQLAIALDNLGVILGRGGDPKAALDAHREAYRHRQIVAADMAGGSPDVPWSLYNLLNMEVLLALPEAVARADELVMRGDQVLGPTHGVTVGGRRLKASLLVERGALEEARRWVQRAQADNAANPFPDQDEIHDLRLLSARIDREAGDLAAAETALTALWEDVEPAWRTQGRSSQAGPVALELGRTHAAAGREDEALRWLELALAVEKASWVPAHYRIGIAQLHLAETVGAAAASTEYARQALAILSEAFGDEHPLTVRARELSAAR
ncbi:MAG: serine/threonine-protein kinase [Pseudomonadota bacterium]